ncbi:MAG: Thymidylate kinase [Candidatus Woesearchaeota archaeon]|nr:Thymidylate kinase [Candidatus Woesearchaeota archaeon]
MGGFVIVDGIDGSGKGVMMQAFREWASDKKCLDIKEFARENNRFPTKDEIGECDVIFSRQPSPIYAGRALSDEIIKNNGRDYSVETTAWAFAIDREILFKRVIIPAVKKDKFVFQERGVVTSLVYQPVQGRITFKQMINMPGNRLALENAPDLMIIAKVAPKTVIERMKAKGKLGSDIFSSLNFQRKIDSRYSSPWLQSLFKKFKTKIVYCNNNPPRTPKETKQEVKKRWMDFLKKNND